MDNVSVNQNIKNGPRSIGSRTPPDKLRKPVLYSDRAATLSFNMLEHDIYNSAQNVNKLNEKKTPSSVYVILGLTALAIMFPFAKKYIK